MGGVGMQEDLQGCATLQNIFVHHLNYRYSYLIEAYRVNKKCIPKTFLGIDWRYFTTFELCIHI